MSRRQGPKRHDASSIKGVASMLICFESDRRHGHFAKGGAPMVYSEGVARDAHQRHPSQRGTWCLDRQPICRVCKGHLMEGPRSC